MCSDKTMGNWHNLNLQVFEGLIKRATRVICLNENLSDEKVEIMKSLRSDFIVINNTFQQLKGDRGMLFDSKWKLIANAQSLLQSGKRLWISSTMSATQTDTLHAMFTKAGFKGVCVTKNTSKTITRDIGKNINTIMGDLGTSSTRPLSVSESTKATTGHLSLHKIVLRLACFCD
ncbi:MAG: hypothetical protein J3R72DRAFT_426988 [Linnemannia gamsii]|nr:MAG: hypothetical protein J3R72DRAFT_426988 [Linnemannia gamsii]